MDRQRIRPPYPTLVASSSSSAYASSSSLTSLPSPGTMPARDSVDHSAQQRRSAPLPSPTLEQRSFFASINSQTGHQPAQHSHAPRMTTRASQAAAAAASSPSSALQQQQQQIHAALQQQQQQLQLQQSQQVQQAQQQQQQSAGFEYVPDRTGAGATSPETVRLLQDYNLVAEAAKRAQVACMIRDMDAMDMS